MMHRGNGCLLRMGVLTVSAMFVLMGAACAMPAGGSLAEGNVTVDAGSLAAVPSGATITAEENSVIDWTHFDIGAAEELHFDTSKGWIINNVRGEDAADFLGKITETGGAGVVITASQGICMNASANLAGTSITLLSYGADVRADGGRIDAAKLLIGAQKISLRNAEIQGRKITIAAAGTRSHGDTSPTEDTVYLEHTKIKSDMLPDVEIRARQVTMKNSIIGAKRVCIWVGDLSGGVSGGREDWRIDAAGALRLSSSAIWADEIRAVSGAIDLAGTDLIANRIGLSIGARTRILRDADGNETREEIEVTQANTLSMRNSLVGAKTISFRAGGVGIWGRSLLTAEDSITPIVSDTDDAHAAYSLRRTDSSAPRLLCGSEAMIGHHDEAVPGFEIVADEPESYMPASLH